MLKKAIEGFKNLVRRSPAARDVGGAILLLESLSYMRMRKKSSKLQKRGKGHYLGTIVWVLSALLCVAVGTISVFNYVVSSEAANYTIGSGNVKGVTLTQYIITIYNYAAGTIGLLAVVVVIIAGYRYMAAMGNPQAIAESKAMAIGAIAGLVLVILSFLILSTLNPQTVQW